MKHALLTMIFAGLYMIHSAQAQTLDEIKGAVGSTPRAVDIPEGTKGSQGGITAGAESDSIVPPTMDKRLQSSARLNAGLGYSCANFDPYDNVEQMLNRAVDSFKELPQQFVLAVQAYVASLPAYLLNKINPTLYNTITKNLDEAFELFEAEYKSCVQLEREIQLGNNPYGQLFKASVARNQSIIISDDGVTIDEAMVTVRTEGAKQGVVLEGGEAYGGEGQDPININRSLMLAGSNLLMGRDAASTGAFSSDPRNPLTTAFESPQEMIDFVKDIYGETLYDLTEPSNTKTTAGIGYQHEYIMTRNEQIAVLRQFVRDQITRQEYQAASRSQIAPEYLKEVRRMSPTQQDIAIDGYARDIAIKQMLEKFDFILLAVTAGMREPNIASSEAYQVAQAEAGRLMLAIQSDIAHLNNARYL